MLNQRFFCFCVIIVICNYSFGQVPAVTRGSAADTYLRNRVYPTSAGSSSSGNSFQERPRVWSISGKKVVGSYRDLSSDNKKITIYVPPPSYKRESDGATIITGTATTLVVEVSKLSFRDKVWVREYANGNVMDDKTLTAFVAKEREENARKQKEEALKKSQQKAESQPTHSESDSQTSTAVAIKWYYFNAAEERIGPIDFSDLAGLVASGEIRPETRMETSRGQKGLARNVKGLVFAQ